VNEPFFNEVLLCGRLAGSVSTSPELVSSAVLEWRLTIDFPDAEGGFRAETFPCLTRHEELVEPASHWPENAIIEVRGTLRRHPWTNDDGLDLVRVYVEAEDADLLAPHENPRENPHENPHEDPREARTVDPPRDPHPNPLEPSFRPPF
jgi:hypothetical protein